MTSAAVGKQAAAYAALAYLPPDAVIGVGTGSTVERFIEALSGRSGRITSAVATSIDTARRLHGIGLSTVGLDEAEKPVSLYVDGADQIDRLGRAIKGGGGAHTQEKRVAMASTAWACIVDESKLVDRLGAKTPVPLEIERAALAEATAALEALGSAPVRHRTAVADSGNPLVDAYGLDLTDPLRMEETLEAIPGVVACGIFARRRADVILVGFADGSVSTIVTDCGGGNR